MKQVTIVLVFLLLAGACGSPTEDDTNVAVSTTDLSPEVLTLEDVTQIIGAPAHRSSCNTSTSDSCLVCNCEYAADSLDSQGKQATLYYLYTEYRDKDAAAASYNQISKDNLHNGVQDLEMIGDAAYFHTDYANFYYGMILKNSREVRIKLSKIVVTPREEDFLAVMNRIGNRL